MTPEQIHIIMPVKDAVDSALSAIQAIRNAGYTLTVYDDYSSDTHAALLDSKSTEWHFRVVHLRDLTAHPSPNYRTTLIHAQQEALQDHAALLIIESDVIIQADTIRRMVDAYNGQHTTSTAQAIGMIAAVTVDKQGQINFPYNYARSPIYRCRKSRSFATRKRLSFCCTMLTYELLQAYDFRTLDTSKDWFDVVISHRSRAMGFANILQLDNPVLHTPHGSRPWKQLKYTHPLRYYWRKMLHQSTH